MKTCCICGEPLLFRYTNVGKNFVCIDCAGLHTVDEIMAETESEYDEPDVIEVDYQPELVGLPENKNFDMDNEKNLSADDKKNIIEVVENLPETASEGDMIGVMGCELPFIYVNGEWRESIPENSGNTYIC